jgi:hypothetical protein
VLAEALTPLLLIGAAVLCAAGVTKLRAPATAARALGELGPPSSPGAVRLIAAVELVIGGWCAIDPVRPAAAALACVYGAFAGAAVLLVRRRAACGCFGEDDAPASVWQASLSAVLALVALCATLWPAHGLSWVLARPVLDAAVLTIGTVAGVYATVIAYTELPRAWGSWSAR